VKRLNERYLYLLINPFWLCPVAINHSLLTKYNSGVVYLSYLCRIIIYQGPFFTKNKIGKPFKNYTCHSKN